MVNFTDKRQDRAMTPWGRWLPWIVTALSLLIGLAGLATAEQLQRQAGLLQQEIAANAQYTSAWDRAVDALASDHLTISRALM